VQASVTALLNDSSCLAHFEAETQRRLQARPAELVAVLDEAGIPHLRSDAGLFAWLDLSAWLRPEDGGGGAVSGEAGDPSTEAAAQHERALGLRPRWMGVAMTMGFSMYMLVPEFFRVVFSARDMRLRQAQPQQQQD
jgi:hypothetical protein